MNARLDRPFDQGVSPRDEDPYGLSARRSPRVRCATEPTSRFMDREEAPHTGSGHVAQLG